MAKEPKSKPHDSQNDEMPPAGPHAKPELIDEEKTPGSGVFPDEGDKETDAPTG